MHLPSPIRSLPRIGFIGFGELGRQIAALASSPTSQAGEVLYFDDLAHAEGVAGAVPFASFTDERYADTSFFVCLGYKHLKRKLEIVQQLAALGRTLPPLVHPSSFVHPTARVGRGTVAYPMCNLDKEVQIGSGVLLNNSVVISHNSVIGDGSYLSPGVVVSGFVSVGARTFIGSGAVISNGIKIGCDVTIGIGTVVVQDVPDHASVLGNPGRILNRPLRLN